MGCVAGAKNPPHTQKKNAPSCESKKCAHPSLPLFFLSTLAADASALVADFGSTTTKIGYAGGDAPSVVLPTVSF
jgi:hypothetical protein